MPIITIHILYTLNPQRCLSHIIVYLWHVCYILFPNDVRARACTRSDLMIGPLGLFHKRSDYQ